jgi:hypothetical protein
LTWRLWLQIFKVVLQNQAVGSWGLSDSQVKFLMKAYPESIDILSCLKGIPGSIPEIRLAMLCLAARNDNAIIWTFPLSQLRKKKVLESPVVLEVAWDRHFQLEASTIAGGEENAI